jgi:protease-4
VYTGRQALEVGLVDQIGTMNDAVRHVAKRANLAEGYAVRVIPEPKNFIEALVEGMSGEKPGDDARHISISASPSLTELALPYLRQLDAARVNAVLSALNRLDLLQHERVLLTMPEIRVAQ